MQPVPPQEPSPDEPERRISRRELLAGAIALGAGAMLARSWLTRDDGGPDGGVGVKGIRTVAEENALDGDQNWQLARPALAGQIAGYAGQVSVTRGETLDVYVSTAASGTVYEADVYRMGWYGGAGGRRVRWMRDLQGVNQGRWDPAGGMQDCASCTVDPDTLLLEANWARSFSVAIEDDWISGVYVIKLRETETGTASYVVFVVRDDNSSAPTIVQLPVNTWQAYNAWGDASTYGAFGADRAYIETTRRAHRVSFARPYDASVAAQPAMDASRDYGAGRFFTWAYPFVRWAEANGLPMTYTTSVDVALRGDLLQQHKLFISLAHDEYWTREQRDAVDLARDAGVNIAFLGANEAYWQVRLEPSSSAPGARVLTAYKDATLDPVARTDPRAATSLFGEAPVSRPPSLLSGLAYGSTADPPQQPWRPVNTGHWAFEDTGMEEGDVLAGLVGHEYNHLPVPEARPAGLEVLARSPVTGQIGEDTAITSIYEAASGATVFNAGTLAWTWGLDDWGHEDIGRFSDDRLRRMTRRIIDRLSQ